LIEAAKIVCPGEVKDFQSVRLLSHWFNRSLAISRMKPVSLDTRTLKRPIDSFLFIIVGNFFRRGGHYCYLVVYEPQEKTSTLVASIHQNKF
jgi:hypothetical protein